MIHLAGGFNGEGKSQFLAVFTHWTSIGVTYCLPKKANIWWHLEEDWGLRSAPGEKLHKALCLLQILWYSSANITACLLRELWVFPWRPGKNQRQKLELSQQETNQEATVIHFICVLWHFSEDTIKNPTRKNEQLGTSSHSWKHLILPHNRGCRPCCLQIRLLPGFRFQ